MTARTQREMRNRVGLFDSDCLKKIGVTTRTLEEFLAEVNMGKGIR